MRDRGAPETHPGGRDMPPRFPGSTSQTQNGHRVDLLVTIIEVEVL
jgi:hypothetical protein